MIYKFQKNVKKLFSVISPLLSEKQNAEKESMKFIQEKQDKADILLKDAREKLDSTECSFEQTKRQADQEEKFLAQRLLSLSNELKITQYENFQHFFFHFK